MINLLTTLIIFFGILVIKFTGLNWYPFAERWGPLFTNYGYYHSLFFMVFLIIFTILIFILVHKLMSSRLFWFWRYILSWAALFILFYMLRSNVYIGDGIHMLVIAPIGMLHVKEALATYVMHLAFVILSPFGLDPAQCIKILYCGLGAVTAIFIWKTIAHLFYKKTFLIGAVFILAISQFGIFQELAGDMEIYNPAMLILAIYIYVCLWALRKRIHPLVPAFVYGLLFCFYSAYIFILPSLFFIIWRLQTDRPAGKDKSSSFFKKILSSGIYITMGLSLPYIIIYGIIMKRPGYLFSGEHGGMANLVPLSKMFSLEHIFEILSMQILIEPAVLAILILIPIEIFLIRKNRAAIYKDGIFLFLLTSFICLFFYSVILAVYGTGLIWRNEFVTSWHTFSGMAIPAVFFSCYFLAHIFSEKKHLLVSIIAFSILSLLITIPLVWWNHNHQGVDFASFKNANLPLRDIGEEWQLIGELDVGNLRSEKKYQYSIGKIKCNEQIRFPPGGSYTSDRLYLRVCSGGIIFPMVSMSPAFVSTVDGGRLSFERESFNINLFPERDLMIVTRMHSGLGEQNIEINVGDNNLAFINLNPSLVESPLLYERYHYKNPTFVNWPMLFEWQYWREAVAILPKEKVRGGNTRISIINRGPFGYGSFHYFIYQKITDRENKGIELYQTKDNLFNFSLFKSRTIGDTWKKLPFSQAFLFNNIPFPPHSSKDKVLLYQNSMFGGNLLIAMGIKDFNVNYISFPVTSSESFVFLPVFIGSLIFENNLNMNRKFCKVFNNLIVSEKDQEFFGGVCIRKLLFKNNNKDFYFFEIESLN